MRAFYPLARRLVALAIIGALSGCSGGGGSSNNASPPPDPDPTNRAPSISGDPADLVVAGQTYTFIPTAFDPESDPLTFSIENRPSWAFFDDIDGTLSGIPTAGDVGTYTNIRISVSDGEFTAVLPDFDVEVSAIANLSTTLNWTAPTLNEDGTPLLDLAGYIIFYGTSSRDYTTEIPINNPGIMTYVVENLSPGTYYFAAKAVNSGGEESRYSGEAVRRLEQ